MPGTVNFKDFKDTVERGGDVKTVDSKYLDQFTDASGDMDPQLKDYFESQGVMGEIADAVNITDNLNLREYIKSIPAEALADTHQLALYLRSTIDGVTFGGKPCVDKELIQITYNNGQKKAFSKQELISHYKDLGHTVKSRADAEALLIQGKGRDPKEYPNHTKSYKTIEGGSTYMQEGLEAIMVLIKLGLKEEGFYTGKIDGKITQNFTSACGKAQNGAWASEIQKYQNTSAKSVSKTNANATSKTTIKDQPTSSNGPIEVEIGDVSRTDVTNISGVKSADSGTATGLEVEIGGHASTATDVISGEKKEVITSQTATVVDVEKKTSGQKIGGVSVEANMIKDGVELVMDGGKKIIIIDKSFTKDTPALVTFGEEEHNVYFNEEGRLITKKSASQPKQKTTQKAESKTDKLTNKLNGKVDNNKVIEKKTTLPTVESELINKEVASKKAKEMDELIDSSFKELTSETIKEELKLGAFLGWGGDKNQRKELEQGLQDIRKEAKELTSHEDKLSFYTQALKIMHKNSSTVYANWKVEKRGEQIVVTGQTGKADKLDSKETKAWEKHIKAVQANFDKKVQKWDSPAYTRGVEQEEYQETAKIGQMKSDYETSKITYKDALEVRLAVEEKVIALIDQKNKLISNIREIDVDMTSLDPNGATREKKSGELLENRAELISVYIDLEGTDVANKELPGLAEAQVITESKINETMKGNKSLVVQYNDARDKEKLARKDKKRLEGAYTKLVSLENKVQVESQDKQKLLNIGLSDSDKKELEAERAKIIGMIGKKEEELKTIITQINERIDNGSYFEGSKEVVKGTKPTELKKSDFDSRGRLIQELASLEESKREKLGGDQLIDQRKAYAEKTSHDLASEINESNLSLYNGLLVDAESELKRVGERKIIVEEEIRKIRKVATGEAIDDKLSNFLDEELLSLDTLEGELKQDVDKYYKEVKKYEKMGGEINEYVDYTGISINYIETNSNLENLLSIQKGRLERLSFLQSEVESLSLENHGQEKILEELVEEKGKLLEIELRDQDKNEIKKITAKINSLISSIDSNNGSIGTYMGEWSETYTVFLSAHSKAKEMDKLVGQYEEKLTALKESREDNEYYKDKVATDFTKSTDESKEKLSTDDYVSDQQLLDYDEFKKNGLAEYSQKEIEKTDPILESTLPSSIALGYVDKAVSPTPSLKIDKVKNIPRLQRYASVVEKELAKPEYQSVLENFDIAINLSGSIKNNGIENAGRIIAGKDIFLNIDYNSINEMKFSRTLHHEMFTALLKQSGKYDTALDDISKLNTEDFDYSSEFKGKYKDADETMLTEGFVSEYAKTTPSNDLSEIAEFLLSGEKLHRANGKTLKQVAQQKEKYPVLSKKVALVQKILTDLKTPAANEVNNNS